MRHSFFFENSYCLLNVNVGYFFFSGMNDVVFQAFDS